MQLLQSMQLPNAHPPSLLLAQLPNLPLVIIRFCLRMIILVVFAAFGSIGFGRSLVALLCMSTILSAIVGMIRREPAFDAVLNHWDEAAA